MLDQITEKKRLCDQIERFFSGGYSINVLPTNTPATPRSHAKTEGGVGCDWQRTLLGDSRTGDAALHRQARSL
jgi:hypothetical protein